MKITTRQTHYALAGLAMLAINSLTLAACPETYQYRSQYIHEGTRTEPLVSYWALQYPAGEKMPVSRSAARYGNSLGYVPVPVLTRPQPLSPGDLLRLTHEDWLKIKSADETLNEYRLSRNDEYTAEEQERGKFNKKAIMNVLECWLTQSSSGKGTKGSQGGAAKNQPSAAANTADAETWDAKALDERQEASFSAWVEQGEAEEQAELSSDKPPRKKAYLPAQSKCLRVVDVKQDSSDKRLYWYAIQNVCNQAMHAHWCAGEKSECRLSKQAWLIQPGDKERSWMLSPRGKQGVQFYGTACVESYKGQPVYYDRKAGKCWAWSAK